MTEQIKDSMETCRIIVHAFEEELLNQRRYNDAKEIEVVLNDMLKAFRSLEMWKKVLNELEEQIEFDNKLGQTEVVVGLRIAINIIKQKLEGMQNE